MIFSLEDLTDYSKKDIFYAKELTPTQELYRHVIGRVIRELHSKSNLKEYRKNRENAFKYVINYSEDFILMCDLAGYENSQWIYEKLKKHAEKFNPVLFKKITENMFTNKMFFIVINGLNYDVFRAVRLCE